MRSSPALILLLVSSACSSVGTGGSAAEDAAPSAAPDADAQSARPDLSTEDSNGTGDTNSAGTDSTEDAAASEEAYDADPLPADDGRADGTEESDTFEVDSTDGPIDGSDDSSDDGGSEGDDCVGSPFDLPPPGQVTSSLSLAIPIPSPNCDSPPPPADTAYQIETPSAQWSLVLDSDRPATVYLRTAECWGQAPGCSAISFAANDPTPVPIGAGWWSAYIDAPEDPSTESPWTYTLAVACQPACYGECGADGCGGTCGACGAGKACSGGTCVAYGASCTPLELGGGYAPLDPLFATVVFSATTCLPPGPASVDAAAPELVYTYTPPAAGRVSLERVYGPGLDERPLRVVRAVDGACSPAGACVEPVYYGSNGATYDVEGGETVFVVREAGTWDVAAPTSPLSAVFVPAACANKECGTDSNGIPCGPDCPPGEACVSNHCQPLPAACQPFASLDCGVPDEAIDIGWEPQPASYGFTSYGCGTDPAFATSAERVIRLEPVADASVYLKLYLSEGGTSNDLSFVLIEDLGQGCADAQGACLGEYVPPFLLSLKGGKTYYLVADGPWQGTTEPKLAGYLACQPAGP